MSFIKQFEKFGEIKSHTCVENSNVLNPSCIVRTIWELLLQTKNGKF